MSVPVNLGERHELHDAAGNLVGYFIPVVEYQAGLNGTDFATQAGEHPCYGELAAECDRLRAELKEVRAECASHRRAIHALLPNEEVQFTKEEVFACLGQKPTLEELIAELEQELGKDHA